MTTAISLISGSFGALVTYEKRGDDGEFVAQNAFTVPSHTPFKAYADQEQRIIIAELTPQVEPREESETIEAPATGEPA